MDFEKPLTSLVWVTSMVSIAATFATTWLVLAQGPTEPLWWKLACIVSLGTVAGAVIPELGKVFTSTHSRHVQEVVKSSRQGGASLNILSGLVAGNTFKATAKPVLIGTAVVGATPMIFSIAIFGLCQAIFMANAGGAWDNAKKIVEIDLHAKGTPLHDATIVGDTVGDPYKDTSSVALNPVIKFTTLFGLLAVELAVSMQDQGLDVLVAVLAAVFFAVSAYFVYRSFYGMRIQKQLDEVDDEPGEPMTDENRSSSNRQEESALR